MRCVKPILVKRKSKFDTDRGHHEVPCGQCISCRLEKGRQWAVRMTHESEMHKDNCFLTVTYDPEYVPKNQSLQKIDLQLFLKRLRKSGLKFRYYAVGEYGDKYERPHYHLCMFGVDFREYRDNKKTKKPEPLKITLDKAWGKGYCHIGSLTWESASYVSKYVVNKLTGPPEQYYTLNNIEPEFAVMSRKPGIGISYFEKNLASMSQDYCTIRGNKSCIPRLYLDRKYKTEEQKTNRLTSWKKYKIEQNEALHQRAKISGCNHHNFAAILGIRDKQEINEAVQLGKNLIKRLEVKK